MSRRGGNTAAFITRRALSLWTRRFRAWGGSPEGEIGTTKPVTRSHTRTALRPLRKQQPRHRRVSLSRTRTAGKHGEVAAFQSDEGKKFLPGKTFKDKLSLISGKDKIDSITSAGATPTAIVRFSPREGDARRRMFESRRAAVIDVTRWQRGHPQTYEAAAAIKGRR